MKQIRFIAIAFAFIFAIVGYVSVSAGSLSAPVDDPAVELVDAQAFAAPAVLNISLEPESEPAATEAIERVATSSEKIRKHQDWIAEVPTPPNIHNTEAERVASQLVDLAYSPIANARAREKV